MKFSIITPTRNCLDKVKRCVGSVRGQHDVAYEHLVQDARSTDGTAEWLMQQPGLGVRSEADGGMYDAINRGWARSDGEILSWLNADEQYLPGTLAKVQEIFEADPELDVVYGNAIIADDSGVPIAYRQEIPLQRLYIANSFLNVLSCTMFFKRRLYESGLLEFDTGFRYAGDMDLVLRLLEAKVKCMQSNHCFSIFGADGGNLSLQAPMQQETVAIRRKYGGFGSRALQKAVLLGRYFERFVRGSYARRDLTYCFALDEVPNYRTVKAKGIGGRFSMTNPVVQSRLDG